MQNVIRVGFLAASAAVVATAAHAQTLSPNFGACYSIKNLGAVPGVPSPYGGITFKYDDPDLLLIGGSANQSGGAIYAIRVTRDIEDTITGFSGTATRFADAPNIDGGLVYGPSNVLFFTRYNTHAAGQIKPGTTTVAKSSDLSTIFAGSVGGMMFVPPGYPGAGRLKFISYNSRVWADVNFVPDGNGTFNLLGPANVAFTSNSPGPEGIVYIQPGNPGFTKYSALITEYGAGKIAAYDVDANGDIINSTRRDFILNLSGAEGGTRDPRTGHFMFSTFGGGDKVILVTGFNLNCVANLNADCAVDDLDFQIFAPAYNILDCADPLMPAGCPADLNKDGFVDDEDFQIFVVAYNGLICK